jgi:hypothetical protein
MIRRAAIAIAWGVGGFLVGAMGGGLLVAAFSSNHFDRQMEEVMTGAFVTGPIGSLIAFVSGFVWSGRRNSSDAGQRR